MYLQWGWNIANEYLCLDKLPSFKISLFPSFDFLKRISFFLQSRTIFIYSLNVCCRIPCMTFFEAALPTSLVWIHEDIICVMTYTCNTSNCVPSPSTHTHTNTWPNMHEIIFIVLFYWCWKFYTFLVQFQNWHLNKVPISIDSASESQLQIMTFLNGIRKLISLQFQTSFINNGLPFLQFQLILEFPLVEGKEIFPGFSDESCDTVL